MGDDRIYYNKSLVVRLIGELFLTDPPDLAVIDEIVSEKYIQHNPLAGQGREGLRNFVVNINPQMAPKSVRDSKPLFTNVIAEGDLVLHQMVRKDWMLVDIFRIEGGMLVEHWDALRLEPGMEAIAGF